MTLINISLKKLALACHASSQEMLGRKTVLQSVDFPTDNLEANLEKWGSKKLTVHGVTYEHLAAEKPV